MILFVAVLFSTGKIVGQTGDTREINLLFVGDVMGHDGQIEAAAVEKNELYDYTPCFRFVKDQISAADLAIANLELTLPGKPPYTGYPQFKSPNELALALKDAGFDILVTANNHSNDSYATGLKKTLDVVDGYGFLHTGTFRDADERLLYYPLLVYKNDFKIAFLNYTYGTNGIPTRAPTIVNLIDTDLIKADLEEANRLEPDAIIVIMHWGDEYQLQENAKQRTLANQIFEWGADIIIGAHPHVVQPVKEVPLHDGNRLDTGLVAFSLGNFISGQTKTNTDGGIMMELTLEKNLNSGKTRLKTHSFTPVWRYIHKTKEETDYVLLTERELEANDPALLNDTAVSKMNAFLKNLKNHLGKTDARLNSTISSTVEMK